MAFSFATPGTGPSAGGIGWFNFGPNFTIAPNQVYTNLSGTLHNGVTVTFDMTLQTVSGAPTGLTATPQNGVAYFGAPTGGYTLAPTDNVVLLSDIPTGASEMSLILTNIVVRDAQNNVLPNYTGVVVDGQTTTGSPTIRETQTYVTNGGNWVQLAQLGNTNSPILTLSGQTATLVGTAPPVNTVYVLTTSSPTSMTLSMGWPNQFSRQGIAFGFAVTQVEAYKVVNGRRFPADQFALSVSGTPSASATTSGAATGLQTAFASVDAIPGNTYSINEAMAPGSVSALTDYAQTVTVTNLSPGNPVPIITGLPESATTTLGDVLQYTITNTPNPVVSKAVTPAFAKPGDTLTYTVSVRNPSTSPVANVLVSDATPAGTTYADNLLVSVPYTGTTPASGITLTSIAAGQTATVSWNVTVDPGFSAANPISNQATVSGTGFSYTTPPATTQVNYADLTTPGNIVKSATPAGVTEGDIVTYTIVLHNSGTVAANNVVLTDAIPAGTTFVPGSVTGATGTPPTLTLTNPIPAGGNATVTFQVQVNAGAQSPLSNSASAAYAYTVDPAQPNGASGTGLSNTVTTPVSTAKIAIVKAASPAGVDPNGIITYTLTLINSGNTAANSVVLTDAVPAGTTFVPGSVTGATGTPPTLTLANPIPAGGSATVTFQVQVNGTLPATNPVPNSASASFTFTADPANPNGKTGTAQSNLVTTPVSVAEITTTKAVNSAFAKVGDILTYTLTLQNSGNVSANNVTITDAIPAGTSFVPGSVTGATGAPPTLTLLNPIPAGSTATITFQVQVGASVPTTNPVLNNATVAFTYTADPQNPDGMTGTSTSNDATTLVNSAIITTVKTADKAFADVGDTITYTITVTNSGNVPANNVVLTDALPTGVSFVPGSLTNATGTPPTLTLTSPVPAGSSVAVTYQVKVGAAVPNPNPVENSASAAFTYTVDPAHPNGASGTSYSGIAATEVNNATLVMTKSVDKLIAYIGDVVTYQLSVKNTGNVPANNVVITDILPNGLAYVPGSLTVNVPATGDPNTVIALVNPIAAGQTVAISFQATVTAIPNPNPAVNKASAAYSYVVIPGTLGIPATAQSNAVRTTVFRNNFGQQISDLIESVALEQAALAAIANAEGAKIQRMAAMPGVTPQQLLCLNKSVSDMTDSIAMLEAVLKQKLGVVDCQINGVTC